jgi:dolichyl-phosphate-mannose--protein O-mannosyl transferase
VTTTETVASAVEAAPRASRADRLWGWAVPVTVAGIGGFLRFWNLDEPHQLVFDETYYVKQAAAYLQSGYELATDGDATPGPDEMFTHGTTDVFLNSPDFVVHPPVGKWMIAAGEWLFGVDSAWGWRFSVALFGTLSLLMIGRIARRLLGSTILGGTAALLLAVDGEHFVLSRTGLLDLFVMFWALAGFGFLLMDKDQVTARFRAQLRTADPPTDGVILRTGIRWWRTAAWISLALSAGVKWSGAFFLAAFAVMSVLWDVGRRRSFGDPHWILRGLFRDGLPSWLYLGPLALVTYVASWSGWIATSGGYFRDWGQKNPAAGLSTVVPDWLRSLWHYHAEMYNFNVNLSSPHPYESNPWSWSVLGRPTAFYYESYPTGQNGCVVQECSRAIIDLGNPVIWWAGTAGIAVLLFMWALRRDWRAGAILAGLVGGYLPWFHFQERTIYTFYAVAFVPWIVLSLTYSLGLILGPADASTRRRAYGAAIAGAIVALAILAFAFFYPILAGEVIPRSSWSQRMWFPSWI